MTCLLVHGNELVISTYEISVCSQHVMNCFIEIHCYQYIGNTRYMFTCYSCCMEMTLIVSVWISFLLVSGKFFAVWVYILFTNLLSLQAWQFAVLCKLQLYPLLELWPTYLSIWSKHVLLQLPNLLANTNYCAQ